ncbi:MAG: carboxypeptidase-like regulatory domain-containing protein, partial [Candidatus Kapaibacteriota bacterium]
MLSTFLKLEICFLLTSLFIQNVFCKELNVVGKVFDKETQKPIAGVRVQIFNTNRGTYTSPSGFFKL